MIQPSEDNINFKAAFEAMPGFAALLKTNAPDFTILAVTNEFVLGSGFPKNAIVNQSFFSLQVGDSVDPDHTITRNMHASFEHVIAHNEEHHLPLHRFDAVDKAGVISERYWKAYSRPVADNEGKVIYIIHIAEEVTRQEKARQKEASFRIFEQAHQLFMQAPVAIHIFRGKDLIVEMANEPTLLLWGKGNDVLGKRAIDVLPEINRQGYIQLLQDVLTTGKSHSTYEKSVLLVRTGVEETLYLNFVLQPYYEDDPVTAAGVMVFCTNVTEQVNTKTELAKRDQSLAFALEISELGVFTVDLQDYSASYSPQIMQWFGLTTLNLSLPSILSKIHPVDQPFVRKAVDESVGTGGRHDIIFRLPREDKEGFLYLRSIGQVQFEDGVPKIMSGFIQDVTDEVTVTKKIQESEERFRTMAEGTEVLIAVADKTSNIIYFNQAWVELTGKPMAELLNFGWTDLIHPDDKQYFLDIYLHAFEKRAPFTGEFRIRSKAGPYRWLLAKVPARFTPDGEFAGYISSCIDITDRKNAEQALQRNDAELKALIAAAPIAIGLLTGRELKIEMGNQVFLDIVGKGNDVIGKRLSAVMPEPGNQSFLQLLDNVYCSGKRYQSFGSPVNMVHNGVVKKSYYDFSYTPLFDAEGKTYAILDIAVDVTEQVLATTTLEKSEENLRNTILQAPVAMCIFKGVDFIVEIANERMLEFWGKTSGEVMHKSIFEGLPEAKGQGFETILQQVFNSGETFSAHELAINLPRNGQIETVYVNFVYEAFREQDGSIAGIMAVAVDVSEQVNGRKKVEESEQRVRSLVESAPFPIGVYIGREMRIALVNQSIIDTWGKGADLAGKLYSDVLPELDNQEIFKQLDGVFTTGIPYHAKNERVDLMVEGRLQSFYFNYSFTPLYDSSGEVYGVMNTAADVTDLNVAKQKVEESERNFRNLVMQAPVGICIVSGSQARVEIVNDSFLEIAGLTRLHLELALLWDILPELADFYQPLLEKVYQTGINYHGKEHEVVLLRNGIDETVFVNFVFEPVKEEDGRVSRVMILVIEVTPQVLARQKIEEVVEQRTRELAEANKALQQNNEELGQFAYVASHDLQEPLRKVSTFSDLLKNSLGPLEEQPGIYLERIMKSTKRMSQLIQDVLDFSQLSRGTEIFEDVDLDEIMEIITNDFELLIEQKKAILEYKDLPVLEAVPLQMQQLFSNLVSNALKFSRTDVPPLITISARELSVEEIALHPALLMHVPYLNIEVADNGIGFSQEYADRIFNIFQRLHAKTNYAGTGIGLALCKKIAQNHKGEISATSVVNQGAVFTIILPQRQGGKK